jgi:O-antigen/teichoic acid export membrane protein
MNPIKTLLFQWKKYSSTLTPHARDVLRGVPILFVIKALSASLALLFSVIIARYLGVDATGVFFLSLAIVTSVSVLVRLGMDNVVLRFVTIAWSEGNIRLINGISLLVLKAVFAFASLVALILFVFSDVIAQDVFHMPTLESSFKWMVLSILPIALFNIIAEGMKGISKIELALVIQGLMLPSLAMVAMFPLMEVYGYLVGASIAYLLAGLFVCFLAFFYWFRYVDVQAGSVKFSKKTLWDSSRPLFTVTLIGQVFIPYFPIFILGVYATEGDVGLFGAAMRLVIIISFFLVAANNIIAPKFAALYARGDIKEIESLARQTSKLYLLFGIPVFLIYTFFGDTVMGIFGEGFEEGQWVLASLAVGQFVNVATGSVGFLLMMCEQERALERLTIYSSLLLFLLLLILTPIYGVVGAAIASSLSLIALNLGSVYVVKKKIGIMPVSFWRKT